MTVLLHNGNYPEKSSISNEIVIPTGAHPDFLLRGTHQRPTCAAFSKESRMKLANATKFDRKSGVA